MPALLGAGIVIGMLIPDIIMKMVMKRDITAMDDYVKSRPVPEKIWNKFLLTTNLVSFWNYVLPVLTLPVFIYFLPVGQVIASFFLFLAFSYIDGIYITCYRKATEWILKWPLILGWMGMFAVLIGYMFVASTGQNPLLPATEVVASFFLFLEFSFVNGIYITCYRKATEWILDSLEHGMDILLGRDGECARR